MSGCGVSITSLDIVPPVLGVDALTVLPLGESIAEAEDLDLSVSLTALITYVCQECCPVSRFRIRRPTLRLCGPFGSVGCTSKRPLFVSRSSRPVSMLMEQRLDPFCPRYAGYIIADSSPVQLLIIPSVITPLFFLEKLILMKNFLI